jgi:glutathione S-transferase
MSYILIGSRPSPFVRRIRMLMEDIPYELKELNIYETDDAITLNKINPINQIPVFIDGDQKIWDSRQIYNYINLHHKLQSLNWDDENILVAIEGAMDAAISLLLMKRSGMNIDEPYMFINRQKERIDSVLDYLKAHLDDEILTEWTFVSMTLYSFLDWAMFRGLFTLDNRPEHQQFLARFKDKPIVIKTAPGV